MKSFLHRLGLAIATAALVFPGSASAALVTIWLQTSDPTLRTSGLRAVLLATLFGAVVCLVFTPFCWRSTDPREANASVYEELCGEYDRLRGRLDGIPPSPRVPASRSEADKVLKSAAEHLGLTETPRFGGRWLLAVGYTAVWRLLHRADECLFDLDTTDAVLGYAFTDELRLRGSKIPGSDQLLASLRHAVAILSRDQHAHLHAHASAAGPSRSQAGQWLVHITPVSTDTAAQASTDCGSDTCAESRAILRQVRHAINEFRDNRREGLIRARNSLFATAFYTGLISYLILSFAVILEVTRTPLVAGITYFLVGAVVGLFSYLRIASARDAITEEDYGLTYARLLQLPLFSGIAGGFGVVITGLIGDLVPTTHGSTQAPAVVPTLDQIFNLGTNPQYFLVAAIFGLTPTLLISRLRQAESYKLDLKSSEAIDQAHDPGR